MRLRRSASPVDPAALQQQVTDQLKPTYQALLRRSQDPDKAYADTYDRAVALLARATRVSRDKTQFEARALLQDIMTEVSR